MTQVAVTGLMALLKTDGDRATFVANASRFAGVVGARSGSPGAGALGPGGGEPSRLIARGGRVGERFVGDTVALLESMKMEIPVISEHAGTVAAVKVAPGDVVQEGDVLVSLTV